ncbi:hypothetical protein [Desulfosudis oleivorans]|uniref:DUF4116 domain-containing protein n=1 Tax=Desulfosudis oleivorans (strain DSM 6200 / JCM 39069 / Hxd3) TaxID=96561 RepID=A8ZXD1_DESOH|nr:hypothetical protein [Desulfosudis oleivorans]ABW68510.1 hypothetical protein Dole_2707 [Desulfosudis oleivorans Hxd3]
MKNLLIVNNVKTELGLDELECIADMLNDSSRHSEVFYELSKLESVEIKESIASKHTITKEIVYSLINSQSIDVLRVLVGNRHAIPFFNRKCVRTLIETHDSEIYASMAQNLNDYAQVCNVECLCEDLIVNDVQVKMVLADNPDTPVFYLTELASDADVSVAETAKNTLQSFVNNMEA